MRVRLVRRPVHAPDVGSGASVFRGFNFHFRFRFWRVLSRSTKDLWSKVCDQTKPGPHRRGVLLSFPQGSGGGGVGVGELTNKQSGPHPSARQHGDAHSGRRVRQLHRQPGTHVLRPHPLGVAHTLEVVRVILPPVRGGLDPRGASLAQRAILREETPLSDVYRGRPTDRTTDALSRRPSDLGVSISLDRTVTVKPPADSSRLRRRRRRRRDRRWPPQRTGHGPGNEPLGSGRRPRRVGEPRKDEREERAPRAP